MIESTANIAGPKADSAITRSPRATRASPEARITRQIIARWDAPRGAPWLRPATHSWGSPDGSPSGGRLPGFAEGDPGAPSAWRLERVHLAMGLRVGS